MRAFIIRPFGEQQDRTCKLIDFDAVERDLIDPALTRLNVTGRTTAEIKKPGNIRVDMFRELVTADIVIADISIHNANVFYELGIRHALRDKLTFLIRSNGDATPFDLLTDRHFVYDRDKPANSVEDFVAALRQGFAGPVIDSPVFLLLPKLKVQDRALLLTVPLDFSEEVERAAAAHCVGDLGLLAEEVRGLPWELEGLRLIGQRQFDLRAHAGARITWEAIRDLEPGDLEANTRLATIHQKLGDLARSDQAIARARRDPALTSSDRAELLALKARNAKACWVKDWEAAPEERRGTAALESPWLEASAKDYADAFAEDLNHFYSGLNALAMLTVQSELGADDAKRNELKQRITAATSMSLQTARDRLSREGRSDIWVDISHADLLCLTATDPASVRRAYRDALRDARAFHADSARSQLTLYSRLGVLAANVAAALPVFPPPATDEPGSRTLLFTGHRVDAPGRAVPRFPADRESVARAAIRAAVMAEQAAAPGPLRGIAGGASGGDILFHEVCAELGIETDLYLALPRDLFVAESVEDAGPSWVERFDALHRRLPCRQLAQAATLPGWLNNRTGYDIWQRNNLWCMHNALAQGGDRVTLIALWNERDGDGPGGTGHLVKTAQTRGAKVVKLSTEDLFGFAVA